MSSEQNLPSAEKVLDRVKDTKALVRQVFSSGSGKDLLKEWDRVYVRGNLYQDSDRATAYALGQRDFVLDLIEYINGEQT